MKKEVEIIQTFSETVIIDLPDLKEPLDDEDIKQIIFNLHEHDEIEIDHSSDNAEYEVFIEDYKEEKRKGFAYQEIGAEKILLTMREMDWDGE